MADENGLTLHSGQQGYSVSLASQWLVSLSALVSHRMTEEEVAFQIRSYASMLAAKTSLLLFDQSSLERAANRFRRWPSYSEVSEFFGQTGELVTTHDATPEDSALKVTNLAHTAAGQWIEDHWAEFWSPAIAGGYQEFLRLWLVKTFASMAWSGALTGAFRRINGVSGYEINKPQDPIPEQWQLIQWRAQADERRAHWDSVPRMRGGGGKVLSRFQIKLAELPE